MSYTKEQIKENLSRNPKWIERSLVVLHNLQTSEEQMTNETIKENGVGFNSSDSRYLSYCAKWVKNGNRLNEKHLTKCGQKLPKYWGQIKKLIESK